MCQILIAGCGYVGTALGMLLAAERARVWGLRRRSHLIAPPLVPIRADLTQPETLRSLPCPLDYLFYTAAAERWDDVSYQATYVVGLENLIQALATQQIYPRLAVFTSSTAIYSQTNGEWIDESSPVEAKHFSSARVLEAEGLLTSSPFPWTVVRLAGIYGPKRTRLIEQVKQGEISVATASRFYTNRIHRDDCAGILCHLVHLKDPQKLYIGSDHEPARLCDVVEWLTDRLDLPRPTAVTRAPRSESRFRSNKRCRNTQILESGYRFRYPTFREGYTAILEGDLTP